MNLTYLIRHIDKFYPQLVTAFLSDYCHEADKPFTEKEYHYGYNSLKWAMKRLEEKQLSTRELSTVFYHIITDHIALQRDETDLQFRILSYPSLAPYKKDLADTSKPPDVFSLNRITSNGYNFLINPTGKNINAKAFRLRGIDAVIFTDPVMKTAGIVVKPASRLMDEPDFFGGVLQQLQHTEPGWKIAGEYQNQIINHGLPDKTPTGLTCEDIIKIIKTTKQ